VGAFHIILPYQIIRSLYTVISVILQSFTVYTEYIVFQGTVCSL